MIDDPECTLAPTDADLHAANRLLAVYPLGVPDGYRVAQILAAYRRELEQTIAPLAALGAALGVPPSMLKPPVETPENAADLAMWRGMHQLHQHPVQLLAAEITRLRDGIDAIAKQMEKEAGPPKYDHPWAPDLRALLDGGP